MRIQASESGAKAVASMVRSGLAEYTSFRLKTVATQVPVADNSSHDGSVSTVITDSLKGWDALIDQDAHAVVNIVASLLQTDEQMAAMLGGLSSK